MSKVDDVRASARSGELARQGSQVTGFLIGTVGYGAVRSRLPAMIGPLPTPVVLGGVSFWMGRKRTKTGAMFRGAAFGLSAGYLTNLGANLGGQIGGG